MTLIIGELAAKLGLDTSEFDSKLEGSGSKLDLFKSGLGLLAGGALVAVGAGLAAAGKAAFDFSSELSTATNRAQAQLGLTAEEAKALGDVAVDVFKNNFGGSIAEATEAVAEVQKQLGDLVDQSELQKITEGAFNIKDAFGVEVSESVNTVKTLMSQFGLTSDQAMDFVTKGFQQGLNSSDDFIDSINEYSNLFADNGFKADEFFSVMETGLQGGALGTDKAADAFKEFGIRVQEMSDEVWGPDGVLQNSLGMTADEVDRLFQGMQDGSVTVADVYSEIAPRLAELDNEVYKNTAGVALFGTQWEDMGANAMLAIDTTMTSMSDMAGATQRLNVQYNDLGSVVETLQRRSIASLQPIGDKLLELANVVMPYVVIAFDWFDRNLPVILDTAGKVVNNVVAFIAGLFQGPLAQSLSNSEGNFNQILSTITSVMGSIWSVIDSIISQVKAFWDKNGDDILAKTTVIWNQIYTLISSVLGLVFGVISSVLTTVAGFIQTHGDDIQAIFKTAFDNIYTIISTVLANAQSIINAITALMRGDFDTFGKEIGSIATRSFEAVKTIIQNNIQLAKDIWANNSDAIKAKALEIWDGIKTKISDAMTNIYNSIYTRITTAKDLFLGNVNAIIDYVEGLPSRFLRAGKAFVENLRDGFLSKFDDLIEDAKRRLRKLTDLLPGSEPKDPTSPLTNLARRGKALVANFQSGIDASEIELPFVNDIAAQIASITTPSNQTNWNVVINSDRSVNNILGDLSLRQQLGG